MKVLIKIRQSSEQCYLVELIDKALIRRIKDLVNKGRHSNAIVAALLSGESLCEVSEDELPNIDADLILTEKHIYLNLL